MTTITVTRQDIDLGIRGGCTQCPIALALRRKFQLPETIDVQVYGGHCKIDEQLYQLPPTARVFVKNFDRSRLSVRPFEFLLPEGILSPAH